MRCKSGIGRFDAANGQYACSNMLDRTVLDLSRASSSVILKATRISPTQPNLCRPDLDTVSRWFAPKASPKAKAAGRSGPPERWPPVR